MLSTFKDYISIARPDHWFKNVFMLPGMLFALVFFQISIDLSLAINIVVGILATCFIASANYVINEWLDAEFDRFHPTKKNRPSVTKDLNYKLVYLEYFLFATAGLGLAYTINFNFFLTEILLLIMGLIYNVEPLRSKDKAYIDVLSESINNPIRFALGWFIFVPTVFPPSSMLVAYWMGGAFLMGAKRFAEYRFIGNREQAGLYRKSFKHYTEMSLLISVFFYAMTSCFFLGIFLIKNRIELLLSFPFFALLFAWYLKIAHLENSPVQKPEKLYKRKYFMTYVLILTLILLSLLYIDIEFLNYFLKNNF